MDHALGILFLFITLPAFACLFVGYFLGRKHERKLQGNWKVRERMI